MRVQSEVHRGHQPLHEVANLVVGVAAQLQRVLQPEAQRHARIGVGAAQDQHQRVQRNQAIEQRGQRITPPRGQQNRRGDQHRGDFQQPGAPVIRRHARPQQSGKHQQAQRGQQALACWLLRPGLRRLRPGHQPARSARCSSPHRT